MSYSGELAIFIVKHNQVVDVLGDGPIATKKRQEFHEEKALRNIAEVAIGCNDKAVVTGNPLEDEKAGFHWAYGRSDHLGGIVSPQDFSAPNKVTHQDIVYAKGNPIVCSQFDFVFPNRTRQTVIRDGVLINTLRGMKVIKLFKNCSSPFLVLGRWRFTLIRSSYIYDEAFWGCFTRIYMQYP